MKINFSFNNLQRAVSSLETKFINQKMQNKVKISKIFTAKFCVTISSNLNKNYSLLHNSL